MQTGATFQSTHWSLVLAAPQDPRLLETLIGGYVAPIYAYLRRTGQRPEQAADLTQEFIAHVILERGLIGRADPARGRFRTFIKSALANFLIDQHRRATARVRGPAGVLLRGTRLEDLEPAPEDDPGAAFDRQWAASVLATALERVEADCKGCGQARHWGAFAAAILEPALGHVPAPPLDELARRVGAEDASQVSSLIQTVRRKFRRALRAVIEETLTSPEEAEDELRDLRAFLGL